jgi:phospholipid/cholesterol/gamma-HCH transport system permease protein
MTGLLDGLAGVGRFAVFAAALGHRLLRPPLFGGEVLRHTWTTAARCLLPVLAVNLPFGMVISLQGLEIFHSYGAERLLSSLVSVTVLRELAPVMASVLVAAQGGSSVAAELGAMRIKDELDATVVMAVDPLRFHVLPRVLGLALSCPMLYVAGATAGLLGGYITAVLVKGEPGGVFLANLWALTTPMDLWAGVLKTAIFGVVIGLVAAFHGNFASGGAAGVGRAVNDTVVHSVLAFIAFNYVLTSALFGMGS